MRILVLVILAVGAVHVTAPSGAQTYDPNHPICLHIYGRDGSYIACGYTSMDQCRSSASGRAAQCIINPYYARGYRRKHHVHRPKCWFRTRADKSGRCGSGRDERFLSGGAKEDIARGPGRALGRQLVGV